MRTTLSLDDDFAFLLKKVSHRTGASFKEVVNRFLRLGLMAERRPMHKPFTVSPRNLGLSARKRADPDQLHGYSRSGFPVGWTTSAVWFDYDSDGKLELFVCSFVDYSGVKKLECGNAISTMTARSMFCSATMAQLPCS